MPETKAGGTQAEPTQQSTPPAGNSPNATTDGTQAEPGGHPSSEPMSLDEAKKLRAEHASLRKRLAEFEEQAQQAELAKLGDLERRDKQIADYQQQIAALQVEQQQYRLTREVAKLAPSLNLVDPDAAQLMLTASGKLATDGDGQYTNVAKLLEELIAEKPYLVASNVRPAPAPPSSGGATNPPRGAGVLPQGMPPQRQDPREAYKAHRQGGGLGNPGLWKKQ